MALLSHIILSLLVCVSWAQPSQVRTPNGALEQPLGTVVKSSKGRLNDTVMVPNVRGLPLNFTLRVLPVGDSITAGVQSSDGNGYRLNLINLLKGRGQDVEFLGTRRTGKRNANNHHEGYGMNRIAQIHDHIAHNGIVRKQPNLVLIHAGTNDNIGELNGELYNGAASRLGALVDYFYRQTPNAVILVAMIIQNDYNQTQTDYYNRQIPGLVAARRRRGYKIRAVNMTSIGGKMLADPLHPNDLGYAAMAKIWSDGIREVPGYWWSAAWYWESPLSWFEWLWQPVSPIWTLALVATVLVIRAARAGSYHDGLLAIRGRMTWTLPLRANVTNWYWTRPPTSSLPTTAIDKDDIASGQSATLASDTGHKRCVA